MCFLQKWEREEGGKLCLNWGRLLLSVTQACLFLLWLLCYDDDDDDDDDVGLESV